MNIKNTCLKVIELLQDDNGNSILNSNFFYKADNEDHAIYTSTIVRTTDMCLWSMRENGLFYKSEESLVLLEGDQLVKAMFTFCNDAYSTVLLAVLMGMSVETTQRVLTEESAS